MMTNNAGCGLRILVLTPQLPYPPHQGRSLRNYNLLRYLAQDAGHQVSLLSFTTPGSRPEDLAHLRTLCRSVQVVPEPTRTMGQRLRTLVTSRRPDMAWRLASPAFEQALTARLAEEAFDVLQIEGIELAHCLWLPELAAGPQRPLVVFDDHNAEYVLQRRAWASDVRRPKRWAAAAYSLVQWLRLRRFERDVCRRSDRVVAVSDADAAALRALDSSLQPAVVPNGVDLGFFHPSFGPAELEHPCVVFTGKMDFRPNIDAVLWFASQVLPRLWAKQPGMHFYVVGQSPSPRLDALRANPHITITGRVDDVRPYIAGADVYTVPLLVGGGTRLKVLEAMAMGQALVSTNLGVEGLGVTGEKELLLADGPQAFAEAVLSLLDEQERRRELGRQARTFVEQRYGWRSIGPRLEAAFGLR